MGAFNARCLVYGTVYGRAWAVFRADLAGLQSPLIFNAPQWGVNKQQKSPPNWRAELKKVRIQKYEQQQKVKRNIAD